MGSVAILELEVASQRWGVPLVHVVEVALRVSITPLAGVDRPIVGLIRFRGRPIPVLSLRDRVGAPTVEARDDHMIVTRIRGRLVAIVVDRAVGVRDIDTAQVVAVPASVAHIGGVVGLADGLLYVVDLAAALSLEEERTIDVALVGVP